MARLFFALRPPEPAAAELARLAQALSAEVGGKPVPQAKIHMTLAFLGDVDPLRIEDAQRVAGAVPRRGFRVVLDRLGAFRSARVAWAGCREAAAELASLQRALAGRLRDAGFELEDRAFTPHLTLVRKIARPVRGKAMAAVEWDAQALLLMLSEKGTGRYSTLASWPLD
ncbi:MAG TPA: RNA 2',3'-cyclic phosphodiesterase [Usitatibacter sp.]|nr:RNA 2',3'-cyclic phosphodiesterase [Usitatibacter sp.]